MLSVVNNDKAGAEGRSSLDEICREGARTMLAAALEAEVDAYLAELVDERDEDGPSLMTRNGHARQRNVQTVAGAVEIEAPRVNDRRVDQATGEKAQFRSVIIPPWCRRSPKVTEVLPLLYLHGLSTGDFAPALEGFFGSAAGLSESVITRLATAWQDEHREPGWNVARPTTPSPMMTSSTCLLSVNGRVSSAEPDVSATTREPSRVARVPTPSTWCAGIPTARAWAPPAPARF
jgi:hypothetical protein